MGHAKRNSAFASISRGIAPRCEVVGRAGLNSPRTALHVQLVKRCGKLRDVRNVQNVCLAFRCAVCRFAQVRVCLLRQALRSEQINHATHPSHTA
ncbi:MAG: hypothetical protein A0129_09625 [Limnobacter sp. CACIAM 66H1]|nr:MAG: hypothetical protein A0129_09625 [Limnobacter sp. CACIAM 66H1]